MFAFKTKDFLSGKECVDILDYQLAVTVYTAMEEEDITEVLEQRDKEWDERRDKINSEYTYEG